MVEWLKQRSTQMAIGTAVLVVLGILAQQEIVPEWAVLIVSGVLTSFGLVANDKRLP